MSVLASLIRKSPLLSFFALAYVFSWWVCPSGVAGFQVFPFGPFIAALVVVAVTVGRGGVRRALMSLARWRAAPRWYILALLLPLVATVPARSDIA